MCSPQLVGYLRRIRRCCVVADVVTIIGISYTLVAFKYLLGVFYPHFRSFSSQTDTATSTFIKSVRGLELVRYHLCYCFLSESLMLHLDCFSLQQASPRGLALTISAISWRPPFFSLFPLVSTSEPQFTLSSVFCPAQATGIFINQ